MSFKPLVASPLVTSPVLTVPQSSPHHHSCLPVPHPVPPTTFQFQEYATVSGLNPSAREAAFPLSFLCPHPVSHHLASTRNTAVGASSPTRQ